MQNIKRIVDSYIIANNMRRTPERDKLIAECEKMKILEIKKLLEFAEENEISKASVYFFLELLTKIGIVKKQERYVWNKE